MSSDTTKNIRVLSTKKLSTKQRKLLTSSGTTYTEYSAISISFPAFIAPRTIENAIFTSQNAVRAIKGHDITIENSFCVGERTKANLLKSGQKNIKTANNALELAHFILKNYKNEHFHFFCGNMRREEIPSLFTANDISFSEIEVYKTTLNRQSFAQSFNGILFYSPSGVQSFVSHNSLENSTAFCIGETTAMEAKKHANSVIVASNTTVESVIAKTVETLINTYD